MPVVSCGIQGSPLGELGQAAASGRPWLGVLPLALWLRLWVGLRLGVRGCAGGCRWNDRFLVLLYIGRFVREVGEGIGFE